MIMRPLWYMRMTVSTGLVRRRYRAMWSSPGWEACFKVRKKVMILVWKFPSKHGDVIKWKHFPRYWPLVRGIHRSPVNFLHKGQWRGALMFSLICARINRWVNNSEVGDLRRHLAHYDLTVVGWEGCFRVQKKVMALIWKFPSKNDKRSISCLFRGGNAMTRKTWIRQKYRVSSKQTDPVDPS